MKVLDTNQLRELDKYTITHEPIASIDLMERAAEKITDELKVRWHKATRFFVFAGPGNNGGDALAVARMLGEAGYPVEAYLFNTKDSLSEDCRTNKELLELMPDVRFTEVTSQFVFPEIKEQDVILDGLFGTGLSRPLEGGFAGVVRSINRSAGHTVSIDIPSGLMGEDNGNNDPNAIIRAELTLTIQMPKLSFFFAENHQYTGEVKPLDIGLSKEGMDEMDSPVCIVEPDEVKQILRPRDPFAHKGTMGHALLVSGQYGMAGATLLAARACMRSGAGKLTVHTPELNNNILQLGIPEAIISHDLSDIRVSAPISTYGYGVMAIGPGLGTHEETAEAVHAFILGHPSELIVDADAINILGMHPQWIEELPQDTILTPHPKELEQLIGPCKDSYERMTKSQALAIRLQAYIIIKGHHSMICTPSGRVVINSTGNAGMATAGSGDVLTGILTGLLARGYNADEACILGVYLHGLAGDIAAEELGEESLMAGDLIGYLPRAFKQMEK